MEVGVVKKLNLKQAFSILSEKKKEWQLNVSIFSFNIYRYQDREQRLDFIEKTGVSTSSEWPNL